MGNLDIWDKVCQPPLSALREIKGGRLAGKTDINPQWRMKAMTEAFGPIGEGWTYSIDRLWTEPGADGDVMAFALVSVTIKDGRPIPGIGGSTIIDKEKNGLHSNDEGFKMAVTDALSVALKALGVGADIYLGLFDGSKYRDKPAEGKRLPPEDAHLADVRDSKGNLAPPRDPGPDKPKNDGTRGALMEWRRKLTETYEAKYPDGSLVLSTEERQDMISEGHPDGRDLRPTDADLALIAEIHARWTALVDKRLDVYHNGDSAEA